MNPELVKALIDVARHQGEATQFSKSDNSRDVREQFFKVLGTENPTFKDIRENPVFFRIVEETLDYLINDGIENNPFFNQFVEYRNGAAGDKNEFYVEDQSTLFVDEVAEGIATARRQTLNVGQSFSIPVQTKIVKIYTDLHRVLTGRMDWSAFVQKVEQAFNKDVALGIYTSIMGASQHLPAQFVESGNDADKIHSVADHVQAATGKTPIIAGTKQALRQIGYAPSTSFLLSENMKDQINQNGILNMWEGLPVIEIPQVHTTNTFDFAVDNKKLLILATDGKPIKLVTEGESLMKEATGTENDDMSQEYALIKKFGAGVVFDSLHGAVNLA
ncbi:hypothetical protein ACI2JA_04080 [Alkalihalobacillus sp. NPDC078783]